MGAFADADGEAPRPVLRPIIRYLTQPTEPPIKIIISGTGFSLKLFQMLMTSGVSKDSSWNTVYTTGDFSNNDAQLAYTSGYLPQRFLLSESGKSLQARMYEWLRGRYRFTARYLEELMRSPWNGDCPTSPHKLLDAYIYRLADFTPINVDTALLEQEADVGPVNIDGFEWTKIDRVQGLRGVLAHSMFTYITRGQFPMWYHHHTKLVEYGLARFTGTTITIEEPLALVSIIRFFDRNGMTIEGNIVQRLQDNQGTALEEVVLWAVTKMLQNKRPLNSIFEFHGGDPDWARCRAQVVSQTPNRDFQPFNIVTGDAMTPADGVAFCAKNPEDVRKWVTGERQAGWCVPGNLMGPDIMTWLQLEDGKRLLLVIQVKCHLSGNRDTVTAEVTKDAIQSLAPARHFASVTKADTPKQHDALKAVTAALEAINTAPEAFTQGRYNILRVIAAFPLAANLGSSSKKVKAALDEDDHALAHLSRTAFVAELATDAHTLSIVQMLAATLKRSRGEAGLDGDTVPGQSAKRH